MFTKGMKKIAGRKAGTPNKATFDIKALAQSIFDDPEYRLGLRQRIIRGKAIEVEKLFYHYLVGKPTDTVKNENGESPVTFTLRISDANGLPPESLLR